MKTRTKIVCTALILAILALSLPVLQASAASTAENEIPVSVNGRQIENLEARLINEITYVPLRKMCEYFADCEIIWNGKTQTAYVYSNEFNLTVTQGKTYIGANGRYLYTVGEVLNIGGSLYVPVRPLAKALGYGVTWNSASRSVELYRTGALEHGNKFYRTDDVYWLSRIINAEAGGESFLGKLAVGNVVLNRVKHRSYPNTIYGVIFDRKYGTQFTPAAIGTIYNTPNEESIIAAKICLEGYEAVPGALFFFNPRIATSFWIANSRTFIKSIGNHDFYK